MEVLNVNCSNRLRDTLNRCPTTFKCGLKNNRSHANNQLRLERVKYLLVKHQNLKIYLVSSSVLNSINGNITVFDREVVTSRGSTYL